MKKKLLTLAIILGLSVPAYSFAVEQNDWVFHRDYDGNGVIQIYVPTRSTSTPAFLTGRHNSDNAGWTYLNECFSMQPAGSSYEHYIENYVLTLEPACFDFSQIGGYESWLLPQFASKVSTSTFYSTVDSLQSQLNGFPQADWTQASTTAKDYIKNKPTLFSGSYNDLSDKPTFFSPTAQPKITDASATASTTAATNGATNAATNLTADSVTILGISVPTNASYAALVSAHNDLATKYNALAVKYNDAATKYNDAATKYNAAAEKLNAIIDALEANGILTP